ncbi:hypothetical protein PQX77_009680, partial [Marasmius sp. AFHP31]
MFDLKKVFEKKFDGTFFLPWYKPTFEGVAMAEKLYDNLMGIKAEPEMPRGPAATTGEGDDRVTVYGDPSEAQLTLYNLQHNQWRQNNQQLMGFFSLTMVKEQFDVIKGMKACDAWKKLDNIHGSPTLSVIYGDFLKTVTFTLNQQNPLGVM